MENCQHSESRIRKLYADIEAYHDLFARIRREEPVLWAEPERVRFRFWIVSKHADIMEIERPGGMFYQSPPGHAANR